MNVNKSNEFNFSVVHGAIYVFQWVASKAYMNPFGVHSLCMRPTAVHSSMNTRKMKFISYINACTQFSLLNVERKIKIIVVYSSFKH